MNILCKLFGHKSMENIYGGGQYVKIRGVAYIDGIGREHFTLYGDCPRCGKNHRVGSIHGRQIDIARHRGTQYG